MSPGKAPRFLVVACVCALCALALMTWQLFDPRVWPIIVAMSLGQVLGTASLAAFGYVVFEDFRARWRANKESSRTKLE
jgi:membrane protein YqaA with SNARE-associated domain